MVWRELLRKFIILQAETQTDRQIDPDWLAVGFIPRYQLIGVLLIKMKYFFPL